MIKSKQLARALFELSEEKTDNLEAKFFDFLEKRNLRAQLPSIFYHFEKIVELDLEKKGIQIEAAHQISKEIVDEIKSFLGKNISTTGEIDISKKLETIKIRKELIGGFRAKCNGIIYDASILTGLKKLEELIIS